MRDNNVLYLFLVVLVFLVYDLYKETQENERLYKICEDQEDVIQLQLEAINSQKVYISQLQYNYNSLYYGQGSSHYIPNKKENTNPIH
jgi:hypothetical protein